MPRITIPADPDRTVTLDGTQADQLAQLLADHLEYIAIDDTAIELVEQLGYDAYRLPQRTATSRAPIVLEARDATSSHGHGR